MTVRLTTLLLTVAALSCFWLDALAQQKAKSIEANISAFACSPMLLERSLIVSGFEFQALEQGGGEYLRPMTRSRLVGKVSMNDDGRITGIILSQDRTKKRSDPAADGAGTIIGLLIESKGDRKKASEWTAATIEAATKDARHADQEMVAGGAKILVKSLRDEIRFSIVSVK